MKKIKITYVLIGAALVILTVMALISVYPWRLHKNEIPEPCEVKVNDDITIALNVYADHPIFEPLEKSPVILIYNGSEATNTISYGDIFKNPFEMMSMTHYGYISLDEDFGYRYDKNFLWCRSYNGRYIMIDCTNGRYLLTLTRLELILFLAVFTVGIIIITTVKNKKIKQRTFS